MKTLVNRTAVVTGAASGIGKALAHHLAGEGCHLALVDIDGDGLARVRSELASTGRTVSTHMANVADRTRMFALPEEVLAAHRQVHVLINNAGVSVAGRFEDVSLEDMDWIFGVNFWGMVHGCKAFLPHLRRESEAHIVTLCSSFGLLGFAGKTGYSATKFAVRGFSEALRAELLGSPIGLTTVYPGPVDTNIVRTGRAVHAAQREAEARFVAGRSIPAEQVARRIVRGIRRNSARVLVGLDYHLIDWMTRLSPDLAQELTARQSQRMPF
ncbi:SDR family NAD(P)-dependent oxidoreductase [Stigmatella sp. ncwal1]|uniref:SDR family NAD(P)-dependent oxidoreductase n=1 Tax=Stigmatella ashevillensis TaxID=2995309 RepID=A0ABT5D9L7_9BACT|nr:SDR family NAD(P)-dependent oxidoreductase [Stigmatella ashevillena]MDC0709734.1 SDR family NAD(P)-dependent oxidoreductase [Stigmatella ashevillena]